MTAPILDGDRVRLRPFSEGDVPARRRHGWHSDIERCYGSDRPSGLMTAAEADAWLGELRAKEATGATCWAVEADGELAGAVFLSNVREQGRKAHLAVGLYSPALLDRGIGSEAVRVVLRHAFGTLGMHRVDLKVLAGNERAIAAYRKCGFVEEGRERESCFVDGRWHDDVVMGVLDREFAAVDAADG